MVHLTNAVVEALNCKKKYDLQEQLIGLKSKAYKNQTTILVNKYYKQTV